MQYTGTKYTYTGTKHTGKIHTGTLYTGTINIGIIFMFKPLIGPILKVLILKKKHSTNRKNSIQSLRCHVISAGDLFCFDFYVTFFLMLHFCDRETLLYPTLPFSMTLQLPPTPLHLVLGFVCLNLAINIFKIKSSTPNVYMYMNV